MQSTSPPPAGAYMLTSLLAWPLLNSRMCSHADPIHTLLVSYLYKYEAPESLGPELARKQWANLMHLFGELVRADLLKYDLYVRSLITRGKQGVLTRSCLQARTLLSFLIVFAS